MPQSHEAERLRLVVTAIGEPGSKFLKRCKRPIVLVDKRIRPGASQPPAAGDAPTGRLELGAAAGADSKAA